MPKKSSSTSNKTRSNVTARTASERKAFWIFSEAFILLWICIGILFAVGAFKSGTPHQTVYIGRHTYDVEVAVSLSGQERGLGGRVSIPDNTGMLFPFTTSATQCFWMKDMHFPLDIIWLGGDKRVTHIERDVTPASYPHQFCPWQPSRYVLELNAGQAAKDGLSTGQLVSF